MPWFRVDDSFTDHPKVRSIPRADRKAAVGLWTLAGAYAARQLTNGYILRTDVTDLGCAQKDATALVTSGLWHADGHDCDRCPPVAVDQYLFHDWLTYQRSRDQVLTERAAAAERQKRARDRAASRRESQRDEAVTNGVSHGDVTGVVTVPPTRPDPTPITSVSGKRTETLNPADARCADHQGLAEPPNCRGCMAARQSAERQLEQRKRAAAKARDSCPDCHGTGWREKPDGSPAGKCDHRRSA
jgi:hypothetical protein